MADRLTPDEVVDERCALQGLFTPLLDALDVLPEGSEWRQRITDLRYGIAPLIDDEIIEEEEA